MSPWLVALILIVATAIGVLLGSILTLWLLVMATTPPPRKE